MNCKNCGSPISEGQKFCASCGGVIEEPKVAPVSEESIPELSNENVATPNIPEEPVSTPSQEEVNVSVDAPVSVETPESASSIPVSTPETPMPQNETVASTQNTNTPKSNNVFIIVVIILVVVIAIFAVLVLSKGSELLGGKNTTTTSTTTTTKEVETTLSTTTTTVAQVSSKVSRYGYNFAIPNGFVLSDKSYLEDYPTLVNYTRKIILCYEIFAEDYSSLTSSDLEMIKNEGTSQGLTSTVSSGNTNNYNYHQIAMSNGSEQMIEYFVEFQGKVFFAVVYEPATISVSETADLVTSFVASSNSQSGTFAPNGTPKNYKKVAIQKDIKLPE